MTYVLSDTHGHRRRFDSVMNQINLRADDTLYVLGDVVDRDPDGIKRVVIYYNCIGAFGVPDRKKIPEADIIMETRKGVALSYAPVQIAV